jgi:hypothetical protein
MALSCHVRCVMWACGSSLVAMRKAMPQGERGAENHNSLGVPCRVCRLGMCVNLVRPPHCGTDS